MALTFDDGWSPAECASIYATLRKEHVAATWFPNAAYVRWDPALWRRIARHFPIGNHTYSHTRLTGVSRDEVKRQLVEDQHTISAITGRPLIDMFRPPYGAYDVRVEQIAGQLGYRTLALWDTDSGDAAGVSAAEALRRAEQGGNGSIVLMHCGPSLTPTILPAIIASYRARGFRFVTLPELLGTSGSV